jgi:hypothetical protein
MTRIGTRLGVSLPAALGAAVLVTAIALGAGALRPVLTDDTGREPAPAADQASKPAGVDEPGKGDDSARGDGDTGQATTDPTEKPVPTDEPAKTEPPEATEKPDAADEPTAEKPEATMTPKPTAKPEPKPTAKPEPTAKAGWLELAAKSTDGGRVVLDWSRYGGDGFAWYKVVRSKDATAAWPLGEGDALVAAIDDRDTTIAKDADVPGGKTWYYRVFAVAKSETGYRILAASGVAKVAVPAVEPKPSPEPTPEPYALGFDVEVTADGVVLDWEDCGSDGFVYYKVVRSTGSNPSYLPWTDGTELIAVVEDAGTTSLTDEAVASGDTFSYRVQAIGVLDGQKVLLGQTAAIEVTVP